MSPEYENPLGVPISGIIFGGRRKSTIPLVYECENWDHGVFTASIIGSETTAAQSGAAGVVRRDPMAMLPFCGYNMGDYFKHWLTFKNRAKKLPKVFMVNWFRKDEDGKFMWPGFRDNSRVLKWMIDRIEGKVEGEKKELGLFPKIEELDLSGLEIAKETVEKLLSVSKEEWQKEIPMIEEFYSKFGDKIPKELKEQLDGLKKKFA
jgi:phosphoenolpyruvate carboxykinase (GTP)